MTGGHLLAVVIVAIALTIFAERRQIQAPLLLTIVGAAVSFIPGLPRLQVNPDLILGLVLPPLLYSAALDFSFFSFMRRLGSILNLGVLMVFATAAAAGAVAGFTLTGLSLPVALMLGAVVAPPDAVSAVSIGSKLGLPDRLMTVLKGESLINDAAALTLFSAAAVAATGAKGFIGDARLYFVYAAIVGVVMGIGLGIAVHRIRRRLKNPSLVTALAIVTPFAAYMLTEELHGSGVVAVVFAGFTLGHNAGQISFAGRLQERQVWRATDGLLEALVFAYMGLQVRFLLTDALTAGFDLAQLALAGGALLACVIVIRTVWVLVTAALARWRYARRVRKGRPTRAEPLGWRENVILSWTGMRGVVTIAAAAGAPLVTLSGEPLPGREALPILALIVAVGTLLLQGSTLPWLIRSLKIDNAADAAFHRKELAEARKIATEAGAQALEARRQSLDPSDLRMVDRMLKRAQGASPGGGTGEHAAERRGRVLALAIEVLAAQRKALVAGRNRRKLDDDVVREILEDIDLQEALLTRGVRQAAGEV